MREPLIIVVPFLNKSGHSFFIYLIIIKKLKIKIMKLIKINYVEFKDGNLKLIFKDLVGLGSCFDGDVSDLLKSVYDLLMYSDEEIKEWCKITDYVNNEFKLFLGDGINIDWRDAYEVVISNVDGDIVDEALTKMFKLIK